MATIAALTLYPIKSCAGIALREATLTAAGLACGPVRDREFMVVDLDGRFVTQRTHPGMAVIAPKLDSDVLTLHAPGQTPFAIPLNQAAPSRSLTVRIWKDDIPAMDMGDEAAEWMRRVLGAPCRLVRFSPSEKRAANPKWTQGIDAPNLFSDSFPFLVISQASLDDLNVRLRAAGRSAIPMNRFRPNIVIGDTPPYAEDHCAEIETEASSLRLVRACQRCPVPAIDQATGIPGPDPQDVLKTYHSGGLPNGASTFGMHAVLQRGEGDVLRVNQRLHMTPVG